MEALAKILTSENAVEVMLLGIFIILVLSLLGRNGLIKVHTDRITIGASDREREIIRQQIEYANMACSGFIYTQNLPEGCDKYRIKYVNELIYDEMVNWISFNHIRAEGAYISIKQDRVWRIITENTEKAFFKSNELEEICRAEVERIINRLVEIRKVYK